MSYIISLAILLFFTPSAQAYQDSPRVLPSPTPTVIAVVQAVAKPVKSKKPASKKAPEAHLTIPKIGVNAVIKEMGTTTAGAMAVPANRIDVGWFSFGTRPGASGTAVIGGHNRYNSGAGVFDRLNLLAKGDIVSVVDKKGVSTSFVVYDIRTYDATDKESGIFDAEDGAHLNLITCTGTWDPSTKSYDKRLVIYTDLVKPSA